MEISLDELRKLPIEDKFLIVEQLWDASDPEKWRRRRRT
jgi:hypothetical protein